MDETWSPCPCCTGDVPSHAVVRLRCQYSGDEFPTVVPWDHRDDAIGWGDRKRAVYQDDDGAGHVGLVLAEGAHGAIVRGRDGVGRPVPHGMFRPRGGAVSGASPQLFTPEELAALVDPVPMALGHAAPPAGSRWITIHPHGPGTEGQAVLVAPHTEGHFRIIGGAGGALNHLILTGVKPAPTAEERSAQDKKRRDKETARKGALSDLDLKEEHAKKSILAGKKRDAQRSFVEQVRKARGGVDEDIDPATLKGVPERAQKRLVSSHHRKQLKQAKEVVKEAKGAVMDAERDAMSRANEVRRVLEEDPEVAPEILDIAHELVSMDEDHRRQRIQERKARRQIRTASPDHNDWIGEDDVKDVETLVKDAGSALGVEDPHAAADAFHVEQYESHQLDPKMSAVDHVKREGVRDLAAAATLLDVARGTADRSDPRVAKVVEQLAAESKLAPDDPALAHAAIREAERRAKRAEVAQLEVQAITAIDREDPEKAWKAIEAKTAIRKVARDVEDLRKLGIGEGQSVPIRDWEAGSLVEVLRSEKRLKGTLHALDALTDDAEDAPFKQSRDGWDLKYDAPPDELVMDVEDELRTQLAGDLVRMSDRTSKDWVNAVAHGRFDALADASLAISGQRHVDRVVADAVGMRNASVLTRWAMERGGTDSEAAGKALEEHHIGTQVQRSQDAIDRANAVIPNLSGTVHDVGDIENALSHIDAHRLDVAEAHAAIGTAIGQLEATAALSQAFREKLPTHLSLPVDELGGVEQAVQAAQLAGWRVADLEIDPASRSVRIPQSAWSRVLRPEEPHVAQVRADVQAVKRGEKDETGWLPAGFYRRAKSTFNGATPEAPRSFQPLALGDDPASYPADVEGHVARRLADGEDPVSIHRDLLSAARMKGASDTDAYAGAVRKLFPTTEDGKDKITPFDAPSRHEHWQGIVQRHLEATGTPNASLHTQGIDANDVGTRDAAMRALVDHPHAVAAFKQPEELTHDDRRLLRDHFYDATGVPRDKSTAEGAWQAAVAQLGPEPQKESANLGLFGGGGPSQEWQSWDTRRQQLLVQHPWIDRDAAKGAIGPRPEEIAGDGVTAIAAQDWDRERLRLDTEEFRATTPWQKYLASFPTKDEGIRAMQGKIRGDFATSFADHHGKVTGQALRRGAEAIPHASTHLRAMGKPEDADALAAELRSLQSEHAGLRARSGGRFAEEGEGAVKQKFEDTHEERRADAENQGALFGGGGGGGLFGGGGGGGLFGGAPPAEPAPEIAPARGQRWSLGNRVEGQLGGLVNLLGDSVTHGKPAIFPDLSMDGSHIDQQRAIKTFRANGGTLGGFLGPGSGKTFIMGGAFTEAHAAGEAQHALITTPAKVVEQFPGELASVLEPGKYKVWTAGDAKYEERIDKLKDTGTHFKVFGHEALRDTLLEAMQRHHGKDRDGMLAELRAASPDKRAEMLSQAREANGIPKFFFAGDEAHRFTYREGAEHGMNLVMAAAAHPANSTHRIEATGTPHRNDEREVWSMMGMLDSSRYGDRASFLHNFGKNLAHRPDAIRRETDHLTYQARIPPDGVERIDVDNPKPGPDGRLVEGGPIALHPTQREGVAHVHELWKRTQDARKDGRVDVGAIKELAPHRFEGVPDAEHEAVATKYQEDMGVGIRDAAIRHIVNGAPLEHNAKAQHLADLVEHQVRHGTYRDVNGETKTGKPAMVFTDWKSEVGLLKSALEARGLRVATVTGDDGQEQAESKRQAFQRGDHDVVIGTSAIEAGGNWQRAKMVVHYDVPQTWKSHQQRSGRAYRIKQQGDVDVVNLHSDAEFEQNALRRLRRKRGLSGVFEDPLQPLDETGLASAYARQLRDRTKARRMAA